MSQFSPMFRQALLQVDIPYLRRTGRDTGELTSIKGAVFIPSRTELGKGDEHGFAEGTIFPLSYDPTAYKTAPTGDVLERYGRRINPSGPPPSTTRPRSTTPNTAGGTGSAPANGLRFPEPGRQPYGALSYTYANNDSVSIRPAVNLSGSVDVVSNGKFMEVFTLCC